MTTLPEIGFGTGTLSGDEAVDAVTAALQNNYRLLDTAACYGNEIEVGHAIEIAGIPREDIIVVTKGAHDPEEHGYEQVLQQFQTSLGKLSLTYIDYYLVHWPVNPGQRLETWRAMEQIKQSGRAHDVGVSNYSVHHLQELRTCAVQPALNQIEFHPYVFAQQQDILEYCQMQDIAVIGHTSFAGNQANNDPVVQGIAGEHRVTPQQVLARWAMQHGVTPLMRSRKATHIAQNAQLNFSLSEANMRALNNLHGHYEWRDPHKLP